MRPQSLFSSFTRRHTLPLPSPFFGSKLINPLIYTTEFSWPPLAAYEEQSSPECYKQILCAFSRVLTRTVIRDNIDCITSRQMGTAVAQWLRCCATNRKVAGSIPAGVTGIFIDIKSFRSYYGSGVDSATNRNEYQEYFLGVKAAGA